MYQWLVCKKLLLSIKALHFFRSHINSVELNWPFSAQVGLTLIWVEHLTATSTSKFNLRKMCTYSCCTVVNVNWWFGCLLCMQEEWFGRKLTSFIHAVGWKCGRSWPWNMCEEDWKKKQLDTEGYRRLWPPHTRGDLLHLKTDWLHNNIRESVDSLCRDGADTQYMQYLSKSRITSPQTR